MLTPHHGVARCANCGSDVESSLAVTWQPGGLHVEHYCVACVMMVLEGVTTFRWMNHYRQMMANYEESRRAKVPDTQPSGPLKRVRKLKYE